MLLYITWDTESIVKWTINKDRQDNNLVFYTKWTYITQTSTHCQNMKSGAVILGYLFECLYDKY
jgi:hypothetical protein